MTHPPRLQVVLVGMALFSAGMVVPARPASACGNSIAAELNESVVLLVESEDDLGHGRPGAAVQRALQRFPDLETVKDGERLIMRAQRIVATGIARMDGLLAARRGAESVCVPDAGASAAVCGGRGRGATGAGRGTAALAAGAPGRSGGLGV